MTRSDHPEGLETIKPPTPHVLVAVDGSERSAGAVRYAAHEAALRGLPLRVLHVSPGALPVSPLLPFTPADVEPTGRAILDAARAAVERLTPVLPVATELVVGPRIAEIVARSAHAALLVLGRETRRGLDRLLTGTTVGSVASRAPCPVAVVAGDWTTPETPGPVVVGIESVDDAPALLGVAFDEAERRRSALVVLHAWDFPDVYQDLIADRVRDAAWTDDARRRVEQLMAGVRASHPTVAVETRVVHDQPAHALVGASAGADLVVVLRHGRRPLAGPHLGSTVRAVLGSSAAPVEVVPASRPIPRGSTPVHEEDGQLVR